jgi:hypothetical protein
LNDLAIYSRCLVQPFSLFRKDRRGTEARSIFSPAESAFIKDCGETWSKTLPKLSGGRLG